MAFAATLPNIGWFSPVLAALILAFVIGMLYPSRYPATVIKL
jgi:hypothetical protein